MSNNEPRNQGCDAEASNNKPRSHVEATTTNGKKSEREKTAEIMRMEANLSKLVSLSKDEKTENALLRSRIDDQSRLIMILKQRADEEIIKVLHLEREVERLNENEDTLVEKWKQETLVSEMLDRRFQELAANHQEMIKIKDEYKRCNVLLRAENASLTKEKDEILEKSLQNVRKLLDENTLEISRLKTQLSELHATISRLQQEAKEKDEKHSKFVEDLQRQHSQELEILTHDLKDSQTKYHDLTDKLEKCKKSHVSLFQDREQRIEKLSKERQEMLDLAMQRGKLIHKEQNEKKDLLARLADMERAVKEASERFQ